MRRYQARLIELQQKGGFGMQQIQALATEELLEEYIRNKCAPMTCPFSLPDPGHCINLQAISNLPCRPVGKQL